LSGLAEELIREGARHAVNLDGGGSTVLVEAGKVISRPTCLDLPIACERAVASIMCIRKAQPKTDGKEKVHSDVGVLPVSTEVGLGMKEEVKQVGLFA
jgi:hypothetical protein